MSEVFVLLARNILFAVAIGVSSFAQAQRYHFSIDPETTFTRGAVEIRLATEGKLFGDFDPTNNPNGSRTATGLQGDIGPTLNTAIQANSTLCFRSRLPVRTSGTFDLAVDLDNKTASLSNYVVERITDSPLVMDGTCTLNAAPFRLASPELKFEATPPPFSIGSMELASIRIRQRQGVRTGPITMTTDGYYRISITFMADVQMDILDLRQSGPVTFPLACSLVGNFMPDSENAIFGYPMAEGGDNLSRKVDIPLEDFPLDLPVSDKDSVRVRLQPTVKEISFAINGMRQFRAKGTPMAWASR
ncbi:MAG: hypothetical protein JSS66_01025 [Armatimonadetes bacterium]|nr:hypothetical protein [Armatimonadota bacterium]